MPDLNVDVKQIDAQHKAWVKRVNELCKSILIGKGSEESREFVDFLWITRGGISVMKNH